MNSNKLSHAIVFSGGASQGAYQVGVLKALIGEHSPATNYLPLSPDILTGTSAGALNASMLLSELELGNPYPVRELEKTWLTKIARTGLTCGNGVSRFRFDFTKFFQFGCWASSPTRPIIDFFNDANYFAQELSSRANQFLESTARVEQRLADQANFSSFVSTEPIERILKERIRYDLIQKSKRAIRIGAVRWDTGYLNYFTNRDFSVDSGPSIIRASSAIPGLFPRIKVNGTEYADGGTIENSPLQGAIEENADVIHVISSFPRAANIPADRTVNTLDTLFRGVVINVSKSIRRDIERYRNVNDAILVLNQLRESGVAPQATENLKMIIDRIMRQRKPDYRRVTIHVHKPPEPLANLLDLLRFDREYIESLINRG